MKQHRFLTILAAILCAALLAPAADAQDRRDDRDDRDDAAHGERSGRRRHRQPG